MKQIAISFLTLFTLSGCIFDNDTSSQQDIIEENNSKEIKGKIYSGLLSGAEITVFEFDEKPKEVGKASSDETGSFITEIKNFNHDSFYLVQACKGTYFMRMLDGKDVQVDNNGCFSAYADGYFLSEKQISIGYLSTIIHSRVNGVSLASSELAAFLDKSAEYLVGDVNTDNTVNNQDILLYDHEINVNDLKIDFDLLENFYIPSILSGEDQSTLVEASLYVSEPIIEVANGEIQEVPHQVSVSVKNIPLGSEVKTYLNLVEFDSNTDISQEGHHRLDVVINFQSNRKHKLTKSIYSVKNINLELSKHNKSNGLILSVKDKNKELHGVKLLLTNDASFNHDDFKILQTTSLGIPGAKGADLYNYFLAKPSGINFPEPVKVQVRLDAEQFKGINTSDVKIAKYDKDFGLKYITPSHISFEGENAYVNFETKNFSIFGIKYFGNDNSLTKEELSFIHILTNNEWTEKQLQLAFSERNDKEFVLYDLLKEYMLSEKIYEKVAIDRDYFGAVQVVYPDLDAVKSRVEEWDRIQKVLQLLESKSGRFPTIYKKFTIKHLFQAAGIMQERLDSNSDVSYTPFAPVKMGDKVFKKLLALKLENEIEFAFQSADLSGGWENLLSTSEINQNVGGIYRKYSLFRDNKSELKETLTGMISERITYAENMDNPYLDVNISRIENFPFKKYGEPIEINKGSEVTFRLDTTPIGANLPEYYTIDYELIRKGNGNTEELVIEGSGLLSEIKFKLPEDEGLFNYYLKASYEDELIGIVDGISLDSISPEPFLLVFSSLIFGDEMYPDKNYIDLIFDAEVDLSSAKRAIRIIDDQNNEYNFQNSGMEVEYGLKQSTGLTSIGDEFSGFNPDRIEELYQKVVIRVSLPHNFPHGVSKIYLNDSLQSLDGRTIALSNSYKQDFMFHNPDYFDVKLERVNVKSNEGYASLKFHIFTGSSSEFIDLNFNSPDGTINEIKNMNLLPSGPYAIGTDPCAFNAYPDFKTGRGGNKVYASFDLVIKNYSAESLSNFEFVTEFCASGNCIKFKEKLDLESDNKSREVSCN